MRIAEVLTPREIEVLRLIAEGVPDCLIASALCISLYTVRDHVRNACDGLGAHSRAEAVHRAHLMGYIVPKS